MKNCYLCNHAAESQLANNYDGLDVDCPQCGVYRISGRLLTLANLSGYFKNEYSKFLGERPAEEKRKVYLVTTEGVKPHQS